MAGGAAGTPTARCGSAMVRDGMERVSVRDMLVVETLLPLYLFLSLSLKRGFDKIPKMNNDKQTKRQRNDAPAPCNNKISNVRWGHFFAVHEVTISLAVIIFFLVARRRKNSVPVPMIAPMTS